MTECFESTKFEHNLSNENNVVLSFRTSCHASEISIFFILKFIHFMLQIPDTGAGMM